MVENKEDLEIREIKYHTKEYSKELELRDEVLRKPLGRSLYDDNMEAEEHDFHIGAFLNNTLVGVMILTRLSPVVVIMRQVSVDEIWRTKNIGKEMVLYAEQYSKNKGYEMMVLNARKSAVGFYEKLGYEKVSEEFLEVNIPHYKMRKLL